MKAISNFFIPIGFLCFLLLACGEDKPQKQLPFSSKKDYEETVIASHQAFLKKEKERIQGFIDSTQLQFTQTGTGLQYAVTNQSEGEGFKKGDIAVIHYQLKSIQGELLYETRPELAHEFMVDFDEVETGLHEAIKELKTGEEAIIILPAHLAHGITGDQAAIPSQTTVVYYLKVLGKK